MLFEFHFIMQGICNKFIEMKIYVGCIYGLAVCMLDCNMLQGVRFVPIEALSEKKIWQILF